MNKMILTILTFCIYSSFVLAQTQQDSEWHEYCEMTVHTKVKGWLVEKTQKTMPLNISSRSLKCNVEYLRDFDYELNTIVTGTLKVKESLGTKLQQTSLIYYRKFPGEVDQKEACAKIENMINTTATAKVEIELVRQDFKSPKNTDTYLIEDVKISFENGTVFSAKNILESKGQYCSRKPSV